MNAPGRFDAGTLRGAARPVVHVRAMNEQRSLAQLSRYARVLDASIKIPGTRWRIGVGLSVSVGLPVALLLAGLIGSLFIRGDERLLLAALACRGGNAEHLANLGVLRAQRGEPAAAATPGPPRRNECDDGGLVATKQRSPSIATAGACYPLGRRRAACP